MTRPRKLGRTTQRVSRGRRIRQGIKSASFIPPVPCLLQAVTKSSSCSRRSRCPNRLPTTSRRNAPLPGRTAARDGNKAIATSTRELYCGARHASSSPQLSRTKSSRASRHYARSGGNPGRRGIGADPAAERVTRIWANRVDYDRLTQLLKEEELEESSRGAPRERLGDLDDLPGRSAARGSRHDRNLDRTDREEPTRRLPRSHVEFSRFLLLEHPDRKSISRCRRCRFRPAHPDPSRGKRRDRGLARSGSRRCIRRSGGAYNRPAQEARRPRPPRDRRGARRAGGALRRPLLQALAERRTSRPEAIARS